MKKLRPYRRDGIRKQMQIQYLKTVSAFVIVVKRIGSIGSVATLPKKLLLGSSQTPDVDFIIVATRTLVSKSGKRFLSLGV